MNRIKQLRKYLGYTQDKLAKVLNISRSTVAMWETTSQLPDYETAQRISQLFNISLDFIYSIGVFKNWEEIIENYDDVVSALRKVMPVGLFMPTFCEEKTIESWLYTRLYKEEDELQLARWFAFSVKSVSFVEPGTDERAPVIDIVFTDEFEAIADAQARFSNGRKIPVYAAVAAGIPIEAIEDIVDYEEIDAALAATGDFFGLRIKGDSMEPRMREGDVVIVRKQEDADNGDIVIVLVNGNDATVKKLKKEPNGITLIPFNPAHDTQYYSPEAITSLPVRIIGKVVELRAKF